MRRTKVIAVGLLLSLVLAACETAGTPTGTAPVGTPGAVNTASVMPNPAANAWSYLPLLDPDAPKLLQASPGTAAAGPDGGPYRFDPAWELASVEFIEEGSGMNGSSMSVQQVTRAGAEYKLGDKTVSSAAVSGLLAALDLLYPAQMAMQHSAWTDDYPGWRAEISGADGQHVQLFASSTGNVGNGPWSVAYNGRLYAQYDGRIGKALGQLFGGRLGSNESGFPGVTPADDISFITTSLPGQVAAGYSGLLAISDRFGYSASAAQGEIAGSIVARGPVISGTISYSGDNPPEPVLQSVKLKVGTADTDCKIELQTDPQYPTYKYWKFACPVGGIATGQRYQYPISVNYANGDGQMVSLTGELLGLWRGEQNDDSVLLPAPPEIATAFAANPMAASLLSDHILGATRYTGSLNAAAPLGGKRSGEAILFGRATIEGKVVRYTVGAQFVIEDGKLTYWNLDRTALSATVSSILRQPLTARVLAASPAAVVNAWYASGTPPQQERGFMDGAIENYGTQINGCGAVPGGALPGTGKPYMAFGYNAGPYHSTRTYVFNRYRTASPFVIIDGRVVVSELRLTVADADPVQQALLPAVLDTGASKPFAEVYLETTPYSGGGPVLSLTPPSAATAAEQAVYEQLVGVLPVAATKVDGRFELRQASMAVNDEGRLEIVSCAAASPTKATGGTGGVGEKARIVYSTYYGATVDEADEQSTGANALAVDADGNAVIAGMTSSAKIALKNAYDATRSGGVWDAFVAKLDPRGESLLLGTYVGSGEETIVGGIALDGESNVYLTGSVYEGFRIQNSAIQQEVRGDADAFIMKLSADGSRIIYAAVLGGSDYEIGNNIAVDKEGAAYITGNTRSEDFHTEKPIQERYGGKAKEGRGGDAFIAKISPDGQTLVYSTYLGGTASDAGVDIAVDDEGAAYVTGYTLSDDFRVQNARQEKNAGGGGDAFVAKISADGQTLAYSTFLGGSGGESQMGGGAGELGVSIAVDAEHNAYVVGSTGASDFPLKNALYPTFNGGVAFSNGMDGARDAFVAALNSQGSDLIFSTYLGGTRGDSASGVGLDAAGNIYVGGSTTSPDFPLEGAFQQEFSDQQTGLAPDTFITKLKLQGAGLAYSTYFGVDGFDDLSAFAVDQAGAVYIAGSVDNPSPTFPLVGKPFMSVNRGIRSAYVAKIDTTAP